MDFKTLSTVFISVFIAELGDKTQLATMLFASDKDAGKLTIFVGAAYVSEKTLHYLAGIGFIAIGVWTLVKA